MHLGHHLRAPIRTDHYARDWLRQLRPQPSHQLSAGLAVVMGKPDEIAKRGLAVIDAGVPLLVEKPIGTSAAAIAPLQDAVDVDDATDNELARLKAWKQYRVALNRLDLAAAPDIDWPAVPE